MIGRRSVRLLASTTNRLLQSIRLICTRGLTFFDFFSQLARGDLSAMPWKHPSVLGSFLRLAASQRNFVVLKYFDLYDSEFKFRIKQRHWRLGKTLR